MIEEDYVSFETAKLLKEKGFCEECVGRYSVRTKEFHTDTTKKYNNGGNFMYAAPTLQMATKWLREVHGIHVNVFRYPAAFLGDDNEEHKTWWFQYTLLKPINEIDLDSRMIDDKSNSYEEAVEAAIKYCLENLI